MNLRLLNKACHLSTGRGYDLRQNQPKQFSIIVHSTNGTKNSSFDAEVNYLYNATNVSAHYIISKTGEIVQFFDDITKYRAWHAGNVRDPKYNNNNSIGIECHYTLGESIYLPNMQSALTELVISLQKQFTIVDIETHRNVAIPKGRKVDPSHLSDVEFYLWKERVMQKEVTEIPIIGHTNIGIDILRHKLTRKGVLAYETDPIIAAYTTFGEVTRMGNVYPLAQWAKETGWGTSYKWRTNRNPAGIGATSDGSVGGIFPTIGDGILAQFAHLLCYATTPTDNAPTVEALAQLSPRRNEMERAYGRGSARTWQRLSGVWATDTTYHEQIIEFASYLTS